VRDFKVFQWCVFEKVDIGVFGVEIGASERWMNGVFEFLRVLRDQKLNRNNGENIWLHKYEDDEEN